MNKASVSLVVFTVVSGLSIGTYIMLNMAAILSQPLLSTVELGWMIGCFLLMCTALVGSFTHLKKPFRIVNAFANPQSMITEEGYWGPLFTLILFISALLLYFQGALWLWLRIVGVMVALVLLFVTSFVYVSAKGIPFWNDGSTVFTFFTSAFLMGSIAFYTASGFEMITVTIFTVCMILRATAAIVERTRLHALPKQLNVAAQTNYQAGFWLLGIIIPVGCVVAGLLGTNAAACGIVALLSSVIGETISRSAFFRAGVHKRAMSFDW